MVYPLRTNDTRLRNILIQNQIFVAKYWSTVSHSEYMTSVRAQEMADTIVPLPIDQRYNEQDMKRILEVIKNGN